jgi:outer membrane lipopolysaccharide assembly protein LptE/RlpB
VFKVQTGHSGTEFTVFLPQASKKLNPKPITVMEKLQSTTQSLLLRVHSENANFQYKKPSSVFKNPRKIESLTTYRIRYESEHAYKLSDDDSRPKLLRLLYVSEENLLTLSPMSQTFA